MARVVGAVGSSHSPQVSLPASDWAPYGAEEVASGRLAAAPYVTTRAEYELAGELDPGVVADRAARCDRAVAALRAEVERLRPDVLLVVGDDQRELFLDDGIPALALFCGPDLYDLPPGEAAYPSGMKAAYSAYHAPAAERYPTAAELGYDLARRLVAAGFDLTVSQRQHEGRGLGHAFTFVGLRLMADRRAAMLPLAMNTYYPPNQPTPVRCIGLGRALRRSVESCTAATTVMLVASGGLSHPIVDETLDRSVLDAISTGDEDFLSALPAEQLETGNSEIRNWVVVAAALPDAVFDVVDYVPGYRSVLGSGCGMGFATWRLNSERKASG